MDITDITIDRECAASLKNCVGSLYNTFVALKEEKEGVLAVGINPRFIPVANDTFNFLVSRNRDICRDEGILNAGCKVGLTIGESIKYLQLPNVDVVEVRFDALAIFGVLLFTIFLIEVERGAMSFDEEGEDVFIEKLKEFLKGVPPSLAESAKTIPFNGIVRVTFLEPDSSAGHSCH